MSFHSYAAYKESGMAWIGSVPSHWTVCRLKHVLGEMGSGGTPDTDDPNMWAGPDDEGIAWVAIGDMSSTDIVSSTAKRITGLALTSKRLRLWPNGTLLFSMYASLGHVAVLGVDAAINQALLALRPDKCSQAYLRHWLSYLQPRLVEQASSNTQDNLNAEKVRTLPVAYPSMDEQNCIAAFLDRETAKIDGLVEEQKRLIELLKEKRQAVISQAVTNGLDPSAPMRDSGVNWLGQVPAHWEVGALRRAFSSMDYGISDSLHAEGRVAVVRMGNIGDGLVLLDDLKYVDDVEARLLLKPGDLLFNRTNSLDQIGKVGLFVGTAETKVSFASYLVRLRTNPNCVPEFFSFLLNCPGILTEARGNAIVAIGQCNLNPTRYGTFRIAIPPREEQLQIAGFLTVECAKLNALAIEAESARSLLLERRSALISAAVTGKIDVRNAA